MCDELFRESDDDSEMLEKSWKKTIDGINKVNKHYTKGLLLKISAFLGGQTFHP